MAFVCRFRRGGWVHHLKLPLWAVGNTCACCNSHIWWGKTARGEGREREQCPGSAGPGLVYGSVSEAQGCTCGGMPQHPLPLLARHQ